MERRQQSKRGKQKTVTELRNKWRTNSLVIVKRAELEKQTLSKEKRAQLLDAKRVRHSPVGSPRESEDEDGVSIPMVDKAIQDMKVKDERVSALKLLQKGFAQGSLHIEHFLSQEGALDKLIGLLSDSDAQLEIESVWCIANITAGDHEHCQKVAKASAPYMITYLSGENKPLQEQCAWALGNIAGDSEECREMLISQGVVSPLISLLKSPDNGCIQSAAFALSNLARGDNEKRKLLLNAGILDRLLELLSDESTEDVITEVSWVLSYLSASSENETKMYESGAVGKMIDLLAKHSKDEDVDNNVLVTPVLRFLGNVFSGPDEIAEKCCEEHPSMIGYIIKFLNSNHRHVIKETLWVLSNLAADMKACKLIVEAGVIDRIVSLLSLSFDIKLEAAYCLCHIATHQQKEWAEAMLKANAVKAFVPFLKSHGGEEIHVALTYFDAMFRILNCTKQFEDAGGLTLIEPLEYHKDENIKSETNAILEKYFYKEEPITAAAE